MVYHPRTLWWDVEYPPYPDKAGRPSPGGQFCCSKSRFLSTFSIFSLFYPIHDVSWQFVGRSNFDVLNNLYSYYGPTTHTIYQPSYSSLKHVRRFKPLNELARKSVERSIQTMDQTGVYIYGIDPRLLLYVLGIFLWWLISLPKFWRPKTFWQTLTLPATHFFG